MRLHHVTITPHIVTLDGIPLTVHENGPTIEPIGLDMSIVHIPVFASTVTVAGDTHDPDEPTPVHDQLVEETYGQILRNADYKGHPARIKFPKGADQ